MRMTMKRLMVMLLAAGAFALGSLSPTAAVAQYENPKPGEAVKAEAAAPAKSEPVAPAKSDTAASVAQAPATPAAAAPTDAPKPPNINKGDTAFMYAAT